MPDGVMAAQVTLTHLVMVRIHVGQPVGKKSEPLSGSVKKMCKLLNCALKFDLFYRTKLDDVGANMSPKNSAFNNALAKHLDLLRDDMAADRIEEITPEAGGTPV